MRQEIHRVLPVSILKKGGDFLISAVGVKGDEGRDGGSQIVSDSGSRDGVDCVTENQRRSGASWFLDPTWPIG